MIFFVIENLEEEDGIQNASIHPDGDRMERLDGKLFKVMMDTLIKICRVYKSIQCDRNKKEHFE